MKADFIASIGSPPRLLRQAEVAALVTPPEQFFRLFCQAVHSRAPIRIGLLLDQYEMLPTEAQPIFNSLLKRENSTSFFTVIACRPFSLRTNLLNGTIQPSEDFSFTLVEYFPPDQDRYRKLLLEIWKRLHPQGKGIETILEDGIAYFADIQRERGDRRAQGQF
jgi:hypothetical protein